MGASGSRGQALTAAVGRGRVRVKPGLAVVPWVVGAMSVAGFVAAWVLAAAQRIAAPRAVAAIHDDGASSVWPPTSSGRDRWVTGRRAVQPLRTT
jgi:hypothetical protein